MIFDLPAPIHALPGSVTVEKMLYDNGLKYLDSIAAEAEGDRSLQRELAAGYKALGDAQGFPYGSNLGDIPGALTSYRKSQQMREKLVAIDSSNVADQIDLAKTYRTIGALLHKTGDPQGASENIRNALKIMEPIAQGHGDNVNALRELGNVLLTLGLIEGGGLLNGYEAHPAVELNYHLEATKVFQKLVAKQPDVVLWQQQVAFMDGLISGDYLQLVKPAEALRYAQDALEILAGLDRVADATTKSSLTNQKAALHSKVGDALLFTGRWTQAVSEYRIELALMGALYDPKDQGARGNLADGYVNLGHAEWLAGNLSGGLQLIRRAQKILVPPPGPADSSANLERAVFSGEALVYEGEMRESLGEETRALDLYQQAVSMFESPALPSRRLLQPLTAAAYAKLAGTQAQLGYDAGARVSYQKALAALEVQPDSLSITPQDRYVLISIYTGLGDIASTSAAPQIPGKQVGTSACECYQKAVDLWLKLPVRNSISTIGFKVPEFDTVSSKLAKCK